MPSQEVAENKVKLKCLERNYNYEPFIYKNGKTILSLSCFCGKVWNPIYKDFVNKSSGCPECGIRNRNKANSLSQEVVESNIQKVCDEKNYSFKPFVYVNNETRIPMVCHCGHEWSPNYNKLVNCGRGCPSCKTTKFVERNTLTQEVVEIRVSERCTKMNYTFKPFEYKNCTTRIPLSCHCGNNWKPTYNDFINSERGCPTCGIKKNRNDNYLSQDEVEYNVQIVCDANDFIVKPFVYIGCDATLLELTCHCGHEWNTTSYRGLVQRGHGCTKCASSESKNLVEIDSMLPDHIKEKRFDDCRYVHTLPFDRYYPEKKILLEYDGEQHFKEIKYWGGRNSFLKTKQKDKIKTEYATENGYNFIRIAYYEDYSKALSSFLQYVTDNPECQVIQIYGKLDLILR